MTRRCPRCGDPMELYHLRQTRCLRCEGDVDRLIEQDDKRRAPRFPFAKDLSGLRGGGPVTLPALVFASQLADGLAYQLAVGHGTELNPGMGGLDPALVLALKVAGGLVLAIGSLALVRRHRTVVAWLAIVGFVGAWTETAAL